MDDNAGGMLNIRGTVLRGLIGTSFALRGSGNFSVPSPPGCPESASPGSVGWEQSASPG